MSLNDDSGALADGDPEKAQGGETSK